MRRMFAADFHITPATVAEDRSGIDFWFERAGITIGVQVKADNRLSETGNLFIETISVDTAGKPGWAEAPRADVLLYYAPQARLVYVIPMRFVRENLARWKATYPVRPTRNALNNGYRTYGLLAPREEFRCCRRLFVPDAAGKGPGTL